MAVTSDLAPGYRYAPAVMDEAAEVIVRSAGPYDLLNDDPRNIAQDVFDILLAYYNLVEMDLGYEATIIDLRASLAAAMARARLAEHGNARHVCP